MNKIVIFGYGDRGVRAYSALKNQFEIVAFSDLDPNKWGESLDGVDVIPPEKIQTILPKEDVVIICDAYFQKIARVLEGIGVNYTVYGRGRFDGLFMDYSVERGFVLEGSLRDIYSKTEVVPRQLRIELSTRCNMKCRYCSWWGENAKFHEQDNLRLTNTNMTWNVMNAIVAQAKEIKTLEELELVSRGEPFLHPEWFEMLSYLLNETTINDMRVSTNGITLTKENADKLTKLPLAKLTLQGSVDGSSPLENDYWRIGSKYEIVKKNLNYAHEVLVNSNFETNLMICNVLVLPPEFLSGDKIYEDVWQKHEEKLAWLNRDFPLANVRFLEAAPSPGVTIHDWEAIERTSVVMMDDLRFFHPCIHSFRTIFVTAIGEIKLCVGRGARKKIGNIFDDRLIEQWMNSPLINEIRNARRAGTPICAGCGIGMSTRRFMLARDYKFEWEH